MKPPAPQDGAPQQPQDEQEALGERRSRGKERSEELRARGGGGGGKPSVLLVPRSRAWRVRVQEAPFFLERP